MPALKSVYPISGEDLTALPVRDLDLAIDFYTNVLGFTLASSDSSTAVLTRDAVRLGLVRQEDHKPEKAGSMAFEVDDLDALHRVLQSKHQDLGGFGIQEWDGRKHRVFFLREADNGYCFCFHCLADDDGARSAH